MGSQTDGHRQTDRQTDGHRRIETQTGSRQIDKRDKWTVSQMDTDGRTHRPTDGPTDRLTEENTKR